jgi:hypothetical protein
MLFCHKTNRPLPVVSAMTHSCFWRTRHVVLDWTSSGVPTFTLFARTGILLLTAVFCNSSQYLGRSYLSLLAVQISSLTWVHFFVAETQLSQKSSLSDASLTWHSVRRTGTAPCDTHALGQQHCLCQLQILRCRITSRAWTRIRRYLLESFCM